MVIGIIVLAALGALGALLLAWAAVRRERAGRAARRAYQAARRDKRAQAVLLADALRSDQRRQRYGEDIGLTADQVAGMQAVDRLAWGLRDTD